MAASASAEPRSTPAAEAAERKRRLRLPTTVVVTVLGIALSAWLIPAFTRQWDDRQKARELKASLVTEMAAATAAALTSGKDGLFEPRNLRTLAAEKPLPIGASAIVSPSFDIGPTPSPVKAWSVAHIQIDAKLRAYFPMQTVNDWRAYSQLITTTLDVVFNQYAQGSLPTPRGAAPITQLKTFNAAGNMLGAVESDRSEFGVDYADLRNAYARLRSHNRFTVAAYRDALALESHYRILEGQLLKLQANVTREVISGHPSGYSTSLHDLLRDLVP